MTVMRTNQWKLDMVASSSNSGSMGDPIREVLTATWTRREALAIRRRGLRTSRAKVIRSLIDPRKLAALIEESEREAHNARFN